MSTSQKTKIHNSVVIHSKNLVNLYGCIINENTQIGPFVEIQKNVNVVNVVYATARRAAIKGVTWFRQGKDDSSCKAVWVGTVKIPKQ